MTKVTIIVPVFNVENYLRQALDSLINQTLSDIEIICVNDGSTDNSLSILEEYAASDSRFKIINQENQGQGTARNNAIKYANGEYLAFVDPDDWVELNAFEKMYNKAKKFNADLIEFSFFQYKERNNTLTKKKLKLNLPVETIIKGLDYPKYIFQPPRYPWNKFFRTELIKNNNVAFGIGRFHEDQNFVIQARALSTRILYCPNDYLYNYRLRISSSSYRINLDMLNKVKLNKELKEFLIKNKCYNNLEEDFYKYCIKGLADVYKRLPDEYRENYDNDVKTLLSDDKYSLYEKQKIKRKSFLESIFGVKNVFDAGSQYKVLIILGKEITLHKIF